MRYCSSVRLLCCVKIWWDLERNGSILVVRSSQWVASVLTNGHCDLGRWVCHSDNVCRRRGCPVRRPESKRWNNQIFTNLVRFGEKSNLQASSDLLRTIRLAKSWIPWHLWDFWPDIDVYQSRSDIFWFSWACFWAIFGEIWWDWPCLAQWK